MKNSMYYTNRRESWRRLENCGSWEYARVYTGPGCFDYAEFHKDLRTGRAYREDDAGRMVRISAAEYDAQREKCAPVRACD